MYLGVDCFKLSTLYASYLQFTPKYVLMDVPNRFIDLNLQLRHKYEKCDFLERKTTCVHYSN